MRSGATHSWMARAADTLVATAFLQRGGLEDYVTCAAARAS